MNKLIWWLPLLLQDRNPQKRISCDLMSLSLPSYLTCLLLLWKVEANCSRKEVLCAFWAILHYFFMRIFSCQAKRLWRTDDITSCWTLPPLRKYAKLPCLSLSVSLPLLHNSVSVDQDTGRLGSDSQGFTCKSESMIQWHWMFSHLLGMYTGEHRHISIKTTAGG